jgi:antitoxin ParD1/3/4
LTFIVILIAITGGHMNVSLTPELEKFVDDTVATGRYSSASELVRASLRKLEEEERWKKYAKAKIAKGLDDLAAGRTVSGEDFLAEIKERRRKKA